MLSWLFYLPGITTLLEKSYEIIAKNRTKISTILGLAACDIKNAEEKLSQKDLTDHDSYILNHTINTIKEIRG